MKKTILLSILIVVLLGVVGFLIVYLNNDKDVVNPAIEFTPTPSITEKPTDLPSPTPSPVPTATPIPSPTPEPTATPKSTSTPTPIPTNTPTPIIEYTFTDLESPQIMYPDEPFKVHDDPSGNGELVDTLVRGDTLVLLSICNETGWYKLQYISDDGTQSIEAYTHGDNIRFMSQANTPSTPTQTPSKPTDAPAKPTQTPSGSGNLSAKAEQTKKDTLANVDKWQGKGVYSIDIESYIKGYTSSGNPILADGNTISADGLTALGPDGLAAYGLRKLDGFHYTDDGKCYPIVNGVIKDGSNDILPDAGGGGGHIGDPNAGGDIY